MPGADILLVQPPWGSATCPPLGLHVLKSHLETAHGAAADIRYLNFDFYERLPEAFSFDLLLEFFWEDPCLFWLSESFFAPFAGADADPERSLDRLAGYVEDILESGAGSHLPANLRSWLAGNVDLIRGTIRDVVPAFLADAARELVDARPGVLGFTAFFNQTMAGLALARAVKRLDPGIPCLLGGASVTTECAVAVSRLYPQMDFVVAGEGELAVAAILDHLRDGSPLPSSGVYRASGGDRVMSRNGRVGAGGRQTRPAVHADAFPRIRSQPRNVFDSYLDRRAASRYANNLFYIPFETSRGCYWMYKSKCTFCGIADNFPFRIKSADHVVAEFGELLTDTGSTYFVCVDNALPKSLMRRAIPRMAELAASAARPLSFFFEMRVDFDRADLENLARLGNVVVQPGIESFSSGLLAHMRKGTTKLQNVRFLRWCRELSIVPYYNILFGFPGESEADYAGMAEEMRSMYHLGAPRTVTRVMILRDSPLWREADHIDAMRPWPEYDLLLPQADEEARALFAYYFTGTVRASDGAPVRWRGDLVEAGTAWKATDERREAFLVHDAGPQGELVVYDGRGGGADSSEPVRIAFRRPFAADAFDLAGDILTAEELRLGLEARGHGSVSIGDVQALVDFCRDRRLFAFDGDRFTRLSVPLNGVEAGEQAAA